MIFHAGYFGQVLEGAEAAVEALFGRIARDERHVDVTVAGVCAVAVRRFPGWPMALVGGPYGTPLRRQPAEIINLDLPRMTAQDLCDTLFHLVNETEKAWL